MLSPRHRFLLIALGLSVAAHIAAALLIILLPRVLPRQADQHEPGTVELLMVEQKGARPSASGQPAPAQPAQTAPTPPRPPDPASQPQKPVESAKSAVPAPAPSAAAPAPAVPRNPDVPAPKPAEQPPAKTASTDAKPNPQPAPAQPAPAKPTPAQPAPTQPQQAPVFDLAGTESESNAVVLGGHVLPASRDDRFRNRPPIYPPEAEMRGDHGTVLVVIHVTEDGVAAGVDVAESSGVTALDRAAVEAVRKWHFRPALQEGHAVPFDMPFRFVFQAD